MRPGAGASLLPAVHTVAWLRARGTRFEQREQCVPGVGAFVALLEQVATPPEVDNARGGAAGMAAGDVVTPAWQWGVLAASNNANVTPSPFS